MSRSRKRRHSNVAWSDFKVEKSETMKLPRGFEFGGLACGIKASGKKDLALIMTRQPSVAAGVYTQNVVCAASIDWNRSITPSADFHAVVVNSGNANACTGEQGVKDNRTIANLVAQSLTTDGLSVKSESVAVLSTGVIGHALSMDAVTSGISELAGVVDDSQESFVAAAEAIMTTDKSRKVASREVQIGSDTVAVVGMAKGAGMIGPNMATMLGIVCTDANVSTDQAAAMVKSAADRSFNRISVEGHTSTNDALILICSGQTGPAIENDADLAVLQQAIDEVCLETAKLIPADGEGATHLLEIQIEGANSDADAEQIARTIASSNLVKTAITGADPNWGRIVSAAGYAGVPMELNKTRLELNGFPIFDKGEPLDFDAQQVSDAIKNCFETNIGLVVGAGSGKAIHWTSDLTVDYVRFNSEYTT